MDQIKALAATCALSKGSIFIVCREVLVGKLKENYYSCPERMGSYLFCQCSFWGKAACWYSYSNAFFKGQAQKKIYRKILSFLHSTKWAAMHILKLSWFGKTGKTKNLLKKSGRQVFSPAVLQKKTLVFQVFFQLHIPVKKNTIFTKDFCSKIFILLGRISKKKHLNLPDKKPVLTPNQETFKWAFF